MARKKKEENLIVKPKLLITIVDRNKTEFYCDVSRVGLGKLCHEFENKFNREHQYDAKRKSFV